ncbi:hypothetical protein GL50803_0060903 [Giardia duodenalis]|uniref:Uncharacterized protein n=1 Tax=Giardia intestinalis (strain ATCC 50803 / WB clone C6) TaxID=184922 RepID=A0A644F7F4_GIAIC|nr:hypothetical protein GL50803_0060903 [Giardia intestinalis]KAE8304523.1 hypothetical protein GL50803_0060903 [Giardia intestinalis]
MHWPTGHAGQHLSASDDEEPLALDCTTRSPSGHAHASFRTPFIQLPAPEAEQVGRHPSGESMTDGKGRQPRRGCPPRQRARAIAHSPRSPRSPHLLVHRSACASTCHAIATKALTGLAILHSTWKVFTCVMHRPWTKS